MSLKLALEKLLDGPCYHMLEVFPRPDHVAKWQQAIDGDMPDWSELFADFVAAVDWPAGAFWRELSEAYPVAPVLLSVRDPDDWWRSADKTIWEVFRTEGEPNDAWRKMVTDLLEKRFAPDFLDQKVARAAFERHNDEVRATIDPKRLVEWRPGDGWEPLCSMLGIEVPDEPYPHTNTTEEFRSRAGFG